MFIYSAAFFTVCIYIYSHTIHIYITLSPDEGIFGPEMCWVPLFFLWSFTGIKSYLDCWSVVWRFHFRSTFVHYKLRKMCKSSGDVVVPIGGQPLRSSTTHFPMDPLNSLVRQEKWNLKMKVWTFVEFSGDCSGQQPGPNPQYWPTTAVGNLASQLWGQI